MRYLKDAMKTLATSMVRLAHHERNQQHQHERNRQHVRPEPFDYAQVNPVEELERPVGWVSGSVTQQSKHPKVGLRLTPNPSYSAANNSSPPTLPQRERALSEPLYTH